MIRNVIECRLLDVEIAGQRTILGSRKRLRVDHASFASSNQGLDIGGLSVVQHNDQSRLFESVGALAGALK